MIKPITALIEDIYDRGMDQDVLIIATGNSVERLKSIWDEPLLQLHPVATIGPMPCRSLFPEAECLWDRSSVPPIHVASTLSTAHWIRMIFWQPSIDSWALTPIKTLPTNVAVQSLSCLMASRFGNYSRWPQYLTKSARQSVRNISFSSA